MENEIIHNSGDDPHYRRRVKQPVSSSSYSNLGSMPQRVLAVLLGFRSWTAEELECRERNAAWEKYEKYAKSKIDQISANPRNLEILREIVSSLFSEEALGHDELPGR